MFGIWKITSCKRLHLYFIKIHIVNLNVTYRYIYLSWYIYIILYRPRIYMYKKILKGNPVKSRIIFRPIFIIYCILFCDIILHLSELQRPVYRAKCWSKEKKYCPMNKVRQKRIKKKLWYITPCLKFTSTGPNISFYSAFGLCLSSVIQL